MTNIKFKPAFRACTFFALLIGAAFLNQTFAQNTEAQIGGLNNNLKQIAIASHPVAPNPNLPGVFGLASFQIQLFADIGAGGYGTMSDPIFSEINSHIRINSGVRTRTMFILCAAQSSVRKAANCSANESSSARRFWTMTATAMSR